MLIDKGELAKKKILAVSKMSAYSGCRGLILLTVVLIGGVLGEDVSRVPYSVQQYIKLVQKRQDNATLDTRTISPECQDDLDVYFLRLIAGDIQAVAMADSYGGKEAGLVSGNIVAEGAYGQCHKVDFKDEGSDGKPFKGRFCKTSWAAFNDPSIMNWCALCLPTSCHQADVFEAMRQYGPDDSFFNWPYPVFEFMTFSLCEEEKDILKDNGAIGAIAVLCFFAFLVLLGTLYDIATYYKRNKKPSRKSEGNRNNNAIFTEQSGTEQSNNYRHLGNEQMPWTTANGGLDTESRDPQTPGNKQEFINDAFQHDDNTLPEKRAESNTYETIIVPLQTSTEPKAHHESSTYKPNTCESILLCFSIAQNAPKMLSFDHPRGSYKCLNAVRFFSMCWIMLGHTWDLGITLTASPTLENYFDRMAMVEGYKGPVLKQYNIGVETFFILSALLTTISFMRQTEKNDNKPSCVQFGLYYFHRFWRLTPVYMIIYMVHAVLMEYLATGPLVPEPYAQPSCRTDWWRHMLYIQNLFPDYRGDRDCMGWMWYIANDFQFYVFAPVSICLLIWVPVAGLVMNALFFAGGYIALTYISYLVRVEGEADYFYDWYVKPWVRCTSYFIGIFLGYLMYKTKCRVKMNMVGVCFAWFFAFAGVVAAMIPWGSGEGGNNGVGYMAFESLQRPVFSMSVFWIIYACCSGYGGFINSMLSWRGWVPVAKLTYTGYIIHPMIITFTYYTQRKQVYVTYWTNIYYFLGTLILTLGFSFVASLFFEMPFLNLEKVMFKNVNKTPNKRSSRVDVGVVQQSANDYTIDPTSAPSSVLNSMATAPSSDPHAPITVATAPTTEPATVAPPSPPPEYREEATHQF